LLLATPVAVPAETASECARYRLHGLFPGMSARDVRSQMDERGDVQRDKRSARYLRGDATIWVEFDDEIGRRSARLIVIRSHAGARADASAILGSLRERLGEPTTGRENLEGGLREGSVVWTSAECGVVIEVSRQEADWWDPTKGGILVEARGLLTVAGEAAVIGDLVEPSPVPIADSSTASESPPAPARNLRREDSGELSAGGLVPATNTAPSGEASSEPEPRVLRLEATRPDSGTAPSAAPVAVAGVGGVTHPERIPRYYVRPIYPPAARRAKVGGTVHLDVIVRSDGTVGEITVVDSTRPDSGFEAAAIAAVKRWRYQPALRDQKPVDASILVRIDFK
jgi:protein TonB